MKTKFKVLLMLIGISAAAYGGSPNSLIDVQRKENSKIFKLTYHGASNGVVHINVTDEKGTLLAQRNIKNISDFTIPLNFENQSSGKFFINVEDSYGSHTREVTLDRAKTFYSLVTALKDNRYLVSVANPWRESVLINIFDEERTLILSQKTNNDAAVLFNLSKIKGQPVFEITRSFTN